MTEQTSSVSTHKGGNSRSVICAEDTSAIPIGQIEHANYARLLTGLPELDRVLGGGIVSGSAVLVGGDPGIGKSTLLLQMCKSIQLTGEKILYASGEESKEQIRMRANRLGVDGDDVMVLSSTDLDTVLASAQQIEPKVMIVDSIQTLSCADVESTPGSVSQVKECTFRLIRYAKSTGTALFIVGHVNKDGNVAGPKILEHMVDAVLYFEGDKRFLYRIVRTIKNRFGPTSEIGVFEMAEHGLMGVDNPSSLFLSGRPEEVSGACVTCVMEGTRPILAEIQALTAPTSFPTPRRVSAGVDYNKICLLLAVLEKRAGVALATKDAYINVAGGIHLDDPAADLAVCLAAASGVRDVVIDHDVVAIGEIGLAGEVRPISDVDRRIKEGARLGFHRFLVSDKCKLGNHSSDIQIIRVRDVREAIRAITK
jgi:DNA repair protein RadA/Sms